MTTFLRHGSVSVPRRPRWRPIICTAIGLFGGVVGLVWLYLCSGLVLDMGGSCGSGDAYVVTTPCPGEAVVLLPISIVGGGLCWVLYTLLGRGTGPRVTVLVWPAVFVSLAWQFAVHGLAPRAHGDEPVWAFLACATVFLLMGAGPLLLLTGSTIRHRITMLSAILHLGVGAAALVLGTHWYDVIVATR